LVTWETNSPQKRNQYGCSNNFEPHNVSELKRFFESNKEKYSEIWEIPLAYSQSSALLCTSSCRNNCRNDHRICSDSNVAAKETTINTPNNKLSFPFFSSKICIGEKLGLSRLWLKLTRVTIESLHSLFSPQLIQSLSKPSSSLINFFKKCIFVSL
jgi:hypothetical protein